MASNLTSTKFNINQVPKTRNFAARYQHLSPAFLLDAVMLLDGAFAETKEAPEGEAKDAPEDEEKG